ncbi:nitrate reductase [Shewanella surugensis]|uniref:Nitrate reductase n=1 Tax=Shewanella surugensis TaxID=212020 RepID=A0ABT0LBL5_9GAMM|nr:nitrate reductase [Shewanella surugensis]MCL1125081.1 nitrate reductase [Shewanella surugensis]
MSQDSSRPWIKTTCAYCGVGCGVEAKTNHQGQLEIRGDETHPANYGKLCSKGLALGETVTPTGRLHHPMIEKEMTAWPQALTHVAQQFTKIIREHGPNAIAFYASGQLLTEDYYVANKLMKGFIGSANIDTNSRLCMSSSVSAHKRAFGSDLVPGCYQDIEHAEMIILVGSNLAWCHPVIYQRIKEAKKYKPHLYVVVIDPRSTASCEIANLHLAIRPGADVALFNGLLCELNRRQKLDRHYIEKHTEGFSDTLVSAQQDTPSFDKLAALLSLSQTDLMTFYEHFANTNKVMTFYSQGVNQSCYGTDKVNAIINCHLATGKVGRLGACPFSITGQPNAMGGREVGGLANTLAAHMEFNHQAHHQTLSEYWQTSTLASKPGLKAIDMFDALDRGEIKAIWIMATNPVVSLPNSHKIQQALEKCPFVVVSDCIEDTDTTRTANVLLPAQGWAEKSGTVTNSERRISRQRRLLPTPGEGKPDWWIISQVAKHMGFESAFNYRHEADIFKEYAQLTELNNYGSTARALNLAGLSQLSATEYNLLSPQQWPLMSKQSNIEHHRLFSEGVYFTSSTKAQFIALKYHLPLQQVSSQYPFILNTGRIRDQWHTMTRSGLSPSLSAYQAEPTLYLHPLDAKRQALQQGELVEISSTLGKSLLKVTLSEQLRRGELFAPIHWSNTTSSRGKIGQLISQHVDAISGQPEFKHTAVNIHVYPYQSDALLLTKKTISALESDLTAFPYWVKQTVTNGYLYHIASQLIPAQLQQQLHSFQKVAHHNQLSFNDNQSNFRFANITDKQIDFAYMVSNKLPKDSRSWFRTLLSHPIDSDMSLSLLANLPQGSLAVGELICACKQVGRTQLCHAIRQHDINQLTDLTRVTQAGSGCGSCLPELHNILEQELTLT